MSLLTLLLSSLLTVKITIGITPVILLQTILVGQLQKQRSQSMILVLLVGVFRTVAEKASGQRQDSMIQPTIAQTKVYRSA